MASGGIKTTVWFGEEKLHELAQFLKEKVGKGVKSFRLSCRERKIWMLLDEELPVRFPWESDKMTAPYNLRTTYKARAFTSQARVEALEELLRHLLDHTLEDIAEICFTSEENPHLAAKFYRRSDMEEFRQEALSYAELVVR